MGSDSPNYFDMINEHRSKAAAQSWTVRREEEHFKRIQNMKTKRFWKEFIERWWEDDKANGRLPLGVKSILDLQHVYFIQGREGGPIKIGRAFNVSARHSALEGGSTQSLWIRAIIPHGGRRVEKFLHRHFVPYRFKREWFLPHPDLEDVINALAVSRMMDRERAREQKKL